MRKPGLLRFILSSISIAFMSVFIQGCEKGEYAEKDQHLYEDIINSLELEEFIIAGFDLQQSMYLFQDGLDKIDFSELEFVKDSEGSMAMVVHVSVDIEGKMQILNEKKEFLLRAYPDFVHLSLETKNNIIRRSIKGSININKELLDMGINIFKTRFDDGTEFSFQYSDDCSDFLSSYMEREDYVEAVIVVFIDGSSIVYIDSKNDSKNSYISLESRDNKYYYSGINTPIDFVAHTHQNSSLPGPGDIKYENLTTAIYYGGTFHFH